MRMYTRDSWGIEPLGLGIYSRTALMIFFALLGFGTLLFLFLLPLSLTLFCERAYGHLTLVGMESRVVPYGVLFSLDLLI